MCQAAKAIGNTELENKFSQGTVETQHAQSVVLQVYLIM